MKLKAFKEVIHKLDSKEREQDIHVGGQRGDKQKLLT